ncbi:MAG: type VI secretion system contractile sheath large subunit [Nitrospira sp.]|nr:type VI secretion system contractile sheath large subunit [Nitrospira sp.]
MSSISIQDKLKQMIPHKPAWEYRLEPSVRITYAAMNHDITQERELPFVIGVMANLSGHVDAPLPSREFVEINRYNFDRVMQRMRPRLDLDVANTLAPNAGTMSIELRFNSLSDFEPQQVASQIEPLRKFFDVRTQLVALLTMVAGNDHLAERLWEIIKNSDPQQKPEEATIDDETKSGLVTAANAADGVYLLDHVIDEATIGRDDGEKKHVRQNISTLMKEVTAGTLLITKDLEATIATRIAEIDRLLSSQLNIVMHTKAFKQLEASWRGLDYLVRQTNTSSRLMIRVLHVSKEELSQDLDKVVSNQSTVFKLVYEKEYATIGGTPYGALIGDYEFGPHPMDMELLEKLSHVAARSHAPFIAAASPSMLNVERFADISSSHDLPQTFRTPDYARWRSFREGDNARYVALTLPHVVMRRPYRPDANLIHFNESITDDSDYLWGNAAYAVGTCLTNAFAKYGWCAAIHGMEGGRLKWPNNPETGLNCPTDLDITADHEIQLANLGFIPLLYRKNTGCIEFYTMQSCQRPKMYDSCVANDNSHRSAQLRYVLTTARFAHYVRLIIAERTGAFQSRVESERLLQDWIERYVASDDTATLDAKAQYPLREAKIQVAEVSRKPGSYQAILFLRPYFQLDAPATLRLVVDLRDAEAYR